MKLQRTKPLSKLNRALFWTRAVMVWEQILPALTPFLLLAFAIAVAAQWGLFAALDPIVHMAVLAAGVVLALIAAVLNLRGFKQPSFTEINTRLALDNGVQPEVLIGLRHKAKQPSLKIGKAKAGLAKGDPLALRYLMLILVGFGYLLQGPVPLAQIAGGYLPLEKPAPVVVEAKPVSVASVY
ncbi:DUF4175 family protein [Asticcacaulis sp. AND118]|uniref:DUF4175 family protein n=1 Tax=Asticcacaulis sp. AND118 TaxID=2840468 RepID=UPI001CFFB2EF|nr:DUF4175 family protein [Asticcacaulis sp. AND118]UDF03863.1 DUF4175 family protein [Asticcacaulis sp. AND118]